MGPVVHAVRRRRLDGDHPGVETIAPGVCRRMDHVSPHAAYGPATRPPRRHPYAVSNRPTASTAPPVRLICPTASDDNGFPAGGAEIVQLGPAPRPFHCRRLLSTVIRLIRKDSDV
ncbi:hypothetical protein GCM10010211_74110 [Streptomyces albospinus]|uniref:Uncharacterized protein n=1 Tax=Streptomyces albospinus TaxID=285515 RepID=A0ABQ2VL90_9ACTN|nr:hypothetical protein GCM10010211_74110 [Streptomyces albospinus]